MDYGSVLESDVGSAYDIIYRSSCNGFSFLELDDSLQRAGKSSKDLKTLEASRSDSGNEPIPNILSFIVKAIHDRDRRNR